MKVGGAKPEPGLPPYPPQSPAKLVVPAGAWDTHAHVIGVPPAYPWVSPRNYDPPAASLAGYIAQLDALGMDYGVLVQISVHGTDNTALLEALRACPARLRGIAVVRPDVTAAELAELHAAGVRGVRIVTLVSGGVALEEAAALARRIAPLDWHMQLALSGDALEAAIPTLMALPVPIVLDHFGGCDAAAGPQGPEFRALLRIVERQDCYVKLSGAYRLAPPPWLAIAPLARALIAQAPDRLVWGSDWPHVAITEPAQMPHTASLLDLLADWTADPGVLRQILVETPRRLYGLPEPADPPARC